MVRSASGLCYGN